MTAQEIRCLATQIHMETQFVINSSHLKKLIGILVVSLLWCINANASELNSFFGINLGDNVKKYTNSDCSPCANGKMFRNNYYDIVPSNPSPYFNEYVVKTTPSSNLIFGIIATGEYKYVDMKDLPYDDPASLFTCKKEMSNLLYSLEIKFKRDMPNYGVFLIEEPRGIMIKTTERDMIAVFLSCEPKRKDRKIKLYHAEMGIMSQNLTNLSDKEMDEINLNKSDTKGF